MANASDDHLIERGLTQELAYTGKVFRVRVDTVALPNGAIAQREITEHPGACAVVPLLPDGQVLLVRQHRYAIGQVTLELPAGKLERPDEPPEAVARRELAEETGATGGRLTFLTKFYPTPGFCNEVMYLYAAEGFELGEARPDEDEFVEVIRLPLAEALEAVRDGRICDGKTIAGLLWLDRFGATSGQTPPPGGPVADGGRP